jgi:integrase
MGVHKKGDNYFIDYYVLGRRKREKIGPSKKLADTTLRKRQVEAAEGKHLDVRKASKTTFDKLAEDFLRLHSKINKKPLVFRRDEGLIKNLSVDFSGKKLSEITPKMIERYKERRKEEAAAGTVNREIACLKCMFNKAIEWKEAVANPVKKVKLFKENNQRIRYLELEEIKTLLENCSDNFRPLVITALNTGMRKGEMLSLKWENVDMDRGIIYLLDTKNGEQREVLMNEVVKNTFAQLSRDRKTPYVFTKENGTPYTDIQKFFRTALKKSGIMCFRFHDLRHTFASHLVMLGVDIKTVQELLGHKTIEMTLRYAHLSPAHKRSAIESLGSQMDTIWTPRDKTQGTERSTD